MTFVRESVTSNMERGTGYSAFKGFGHRRTWRLSHQWPHSGAVRCWFILRCAHRLLYNQINR